MICPKCNTPNPGVAKFCMNCGTSLAAGINDGQNSGLTAKDAENAKNAKKDSNLGGLGELGGSKFLGQYLPPELVAKLEAARARDAMAGERRVITMLFCDIKGSTAAAGQVDPEVWTDIMNGAFERMIGPIYQYEGTVPRLMGDAILAFFGAPIAHEDDPQRAVWAGLEIQARMQPYAEEMRLKHGVDFGLRVGINTGLVVVGEIGSDLRMEYTAIGDAINLAARMEQTAAPGTVQITEETHKLIAPLFDFEPLGGIEIKGKSEPVTAYRVLGRKAEPGQLRGLEGLSSPLVGRDEQLAVLRERLSALAAGEGGFVAVIGEAGLGKSSLVGEVQKEEITAKHAKTAKKSLNPKEPNLEVQKEEITATPIRGQANAKTAKKSFELKESNLGELGELGQLGAQDPSGPAWLKGEAFSYSRSISYFPWRQIIRRSIEAREDDAPEEVRRKLKGQCDCCTLPGGDVPFLEAMLAVESEESLQVVMGYQGEALVERMTEAARGYLCGLAGERPLTLVFDDLHWADEASLNLLLNASSLASEQPILFLCMLRPDKDAPSWRSMQEVEAGLSGRFRSITLQPLGTDQTDALLANLLGMKGLPPKLRDMIVEKAGGNPFFVEELIRSLIETGQIVRENSHWRAAGEDASVSLPGTLRGVLGARIDRLPETSRHILQMAAVIGRSFDLRVLERLARVEGLDVHVAQLKEAGLVEGEVEGRPAGLPLQDGAADTEGKSEIASRKNARNDKKLGEMSFRHVLIQEAAYDSILMKRRPELHRQVGEALEELNAGRIEEFAPVLAHHFYAAQDDRSLKYDLLAGEKAARLYANAEAATHFRRALETATRIGAGTVQVAELYSKLGGVLELAGRYPEALSTYDGMLAFAREQGDKSVELNALMAKATIYSIYSQQHDAALSEQLLLLALEVSAQIGDRAMQTKLNWNLMLVYLFSRRLPQALEHGERALALGREAGEREQLAFVLNDLCRLYVCLGRFDEAYAVVQEARDLWVALDIQPMYIDSLGAEAEARYNHGELVKALELSTQALELSEGIDNMWGQAYNRMLMAFVLATEGEIGRAIELWDKAVQLGDKGSLLATTIGTRTDLAWIYGFYGAVDQGLQLVDEAIAAAEQKQPDWLDLPRAVKMRLHLLNGDLEAAQAISGTPLRPITIPYVRYTVVIGLANVERALAGDEGERALSLVDELIQGTTELTWPDMPEILRLRGEVLAALGRLDEASQVLMEACSRARQVGAGHHLWPALASLAEVEARMGRESEAGASRAEARKIVEEIGEGLGEVGMRERFLARAEALFSTETRRKRN